MSLKQHADNIRTRIIKEAYEKQLGHVGSCLSCVEILTTIFFKLMKPGDIFVLSPGHKALALYATLVEKGVIDKIDMEALGGHPKRNPKLGIYFSTGSLGHGLSLGLGMAIARPKSKVYVLLSDGDTDEGSTQEALKMARKSSINNLHAVVDCNGWSAYQKCDYVWLLDGTPTTDMDLMADKIRHNLIFGFRTIKGKGLPRFEDKLESHYWKISEEDYAEFVRRSTT